MLLLRTATARSQCKIGLATAGAERKNSCSLSLLDDDEDSSSSSYVRARLGTSDAIDDEKVDDIESSGAGRL